MSDLIGAEQSGTAPREDIFEPYGQLIIVKKAEVETKRQVILPESVRKKGMIDPLRFEVVSVGKGRICDMTRKHIKIELEAGDIVMLSPHASIHYVGTNSDGEELVCVNENSVICVIH